MLPGRLSLSLWDFFKQTILKIIVSFIFLPTQQLCRFCSEKDHDDIFNKNISEQINKNISSGYPSMMLDIFLDCWCQWSPMRISYHDNWPIIGRETDISFNLSPYAKVVQVSEEITKILKIKNTQHWISRWNLRSTKLKIPGIIEVFSDIF